MTASALNAWYITNMHRVCKVPRSQLHTASQRQQPATRARVQDSTDHETTTQRENLEKYESFVGGEKLHDAPDYTRGGVGSRYATIAVMLSALLPKFRAARLRFADMSDDTTSCADRAAAAASTHLPSSRNCDTSSNFQLSQMPSEHSAMPSGCVDSVGDRASTSPRSRKHTSGSCLHGTAVDVYKYKKPRTHDVHGQARRYAGSYTRRRSQRSIALAAARTTLRRTGGAGRPESA